MELTMKDLKQMNNNVITMKSENDSVDDEDVAMSTAPV